jgi:hypothetical protein
MKEKTIYLMGGFGNVLFQLNYLYNLKLQGVLVNADCTLLNNTFLIKKILRWSDHRTLDVLNDLQLLDDIHVNYNAYYNILAGAVTKIIDRDFLWSRYYGRYAPLVNDVTADHIFGYFHENNPINISFINKIKNGISQLLISDDCSHIREALKTVGDDFVVHVRGGDYAHDPAFAISNDYYKKALRGQRKCYIVTNDKVFSKTIFKDIEIEYEFLNINTTLEDFIILALCKNKILANSTFSWWAAELSAPDNIIIQKEPFFDHINRWVPDSHVPRRLVSHQNSSAKVIH